MCQAVKDQKWLILYILVIIAGLFYFGGKFQTNVKAAEIDETQQIEDFDSVMGAVPKPNGEFTGNLTVSQQMKLINQLINLDPRFFNYSQYKENDALDYVFYKDALSFVMVVKEHLNLTRTDDAFGLKYRFYDTSGGRVYRFDDDMNFLYDFDSSEFDYMYITNSEFFYSSIIGGKLERFFPLINQLNGTTLGVNDYLQPDEDYSGYKYVKEFPRSLGNSSKKVEFRVQKKILAKLIELEPNLYDFQGLLEKGSKIRYLVSDMNNKYQVAIYNSHEGFDVYRNSEIVVNSNDMVVYSFDLDGNFMYKNGEDTYWGYSFKNIIYSNFYGSSVERLWKMLEYMNGTPEGSSGIVKLPEKDTDEPTEPSDPLPEETPEEEEQSGIGIWFGDLWDSEKYKFDNDFIQIFSMIGVYSKLFNFNYHLWNGGAPSEAQIEQLGPYWAEYIRPSYGLAVFEIDVLGVRLPMTKIQEIISEKTYWISMIFRSLITISTITYCYNKLRQTFAPMY